MSDTLQTDLLVLGGGPGGYTAAFRAADLGKEVVIVEERDTLGGVCLNVGCIPSKTLLHAADIIHEASSMAGKGIDFGKPKINLEAIRENRDGVINTLSNGLAGLAKRRKVQIVNGRGRFADAHTLTVTTGSGEQTITFQQAIIAVGSIPVIFDEWPNDDPRLMDSTDALALADVPKRMLVVGGGIIGCEMATVYAALGSQVSIVELGDQLIPGADKDIVAPLETRLNEICFSIDTGALVKSVSASKKGLTAEISIDGNTERKIYDAILLAVGRKPNSAGINADRAGINVDENGFIRVDNQCRTNLPNVFAIGDVVGQPMLAHKASYEARLAAEVCAGHDVSYHAWTIPSVAYTDPEIAWAGHTEASALAANIPCEVARFPWAGNGRNLGIGRSDGLTKLLFDPDTGRILGAAITGKNAGELIAEAVTAMEMCATIKDISLIVHPHPTLAETLAMAAEVALGSCTEASPIKKTGT